MSKEQRTLWQRWAGGKSGLLRKGVCREREDPGTFRASRRCDWTANRWDRVVRWEVKSKVCGQAPWIFTPVTLDPACSKGKTRFFKLSLQDLGADFQIPFIFISVLGICPLGMPIDEVGKLEESGIIHGQGQFKYF